MNIKTKSIKKALNKVGGHTLEEVNKLHKENQKKMREDEKFNKNMEIFGSPIVGGKSGKKKFIK